MAENGNLLIQSFFLGLAIAAAYDILRILRRLIPHGGVLSGLEDLLYWAAVTFFSFQMLQRAGCGTLRWFSAAGVVAGVALFEHFIGAPILSKVTAHRRKRVDGNTQTD